MVRRSLLLLAVALVAPSIHAAEGHEGGNGGDAVVCFSSTTTRDAVLNVLEQNAQRMNKIDPLGGGRDKDIRSVRLLDLYEAELRRDYRPQRLRGSRDEILAQLYAQIAEKASLHWTLQDQAQRLRWYETSNGIFEINDSDHRILFADQCLILQMGYQVRIGETYEIYVDKRLESRLPAMDQAAFYLHELLLSFRQGRGREQPTTMVRRLVAYLFSQEFAEDEPEAFNSRVNEAIRVPFGIRRQVSFGASVFDGYADDAKRFIAPLNLPQKMQLPFGEILVTGPILMDRNGRYAVRMEGEVFYRGLHISGGDRGEILLFSDSLLPSEFSFARAGEVFGYTFPAKTRMAVLPNWTEAHILLGDEMTIGPVTYPAGMQFYWKSDGGLQSWFNEVTGVVRVQLRPDQPVGTCRADSSVRNGKLTSCKYANFPGPMGPFARVLPDKDGVVYFHEDGLPNSGVLAEDFVVRGVTCLAGATLERGWYFAKCSHARPSSSAKGPERHFVGQTVSIDWAENNHHSPIIRFGERTVVIDGISCMREAGFHHQTGHLETCISAKKQRVRRRTYQRGEEIRL